MKDNMNNTSECDKLVKKKYYGLSSKEYTKEEFTDYLMTRIIEEKSKLQIDASSYLESQQFRSDILSFIKKVCCNYWVQYQCDKSASKINNIYRESLKFLPTKVMKLFKNQLAISWILDNLQKIEKNECNETFSMEFLRKFESTKNGINEIIKNFKPSEDSLVRIITSQTNIIKEAFDSIDNDLKKEININVLVIGVLGIGKSTLISVIEGFLNSINNTETQERNISENGRGTTEIEKTDIKIGHITVTFIDTIGFGDPGQGFTTGDVWNLIRSYEISEIDTVLYCVDGDKPRLDETDINSLKNLFIEFKKIFPNSLDWWKKVTVVLTKINRIWETTKVPSHEIAQWLTENDLEFTKENYDSYNKIYADQVKPLISLTKNAIRERVRKKLYYSGDSLNPRTDEREREDFSFWFERLAKDYYPDISRESIKKCIEENLASVLISTASQHKDRAMIKNDYKNCTIDPIPLFNFNKGVTSFLENEINSNVVSKNWFQDLMNRIYSNTSSDNFRLTILKLNEQRRMNTNESESNNTSLNFDETSNERTNQTFNRVIQEATFWSRVGYIFTLGFCGQW